MQIVRIDQKCSISEHCARYHHTVPIFGTVVVLNNLPNFRFEIVMLLTNQAQCVRKLRCVCVCKGGGVNLVISFNRSCHYQENEWQIADLTACEAELTNLQNI